MTKYLSEGNQNRGLFRNNLDVCQKFLSPQVSNEIRITLNPFEPYEDRYSIQLKFSSILVQA